MVILFWYFQKKNLKIQQEKGILEEEKKEVENINTQQAQEIEKLKITLFEKIEAIKQSNIAFAELSINENMFQNVEDSEDNETDIETELFDELREQENVTEQKLQVLRNFNLTRKDQWKDFKASFLDIYPDFESKFSDKMTSVSDAELRLMMLQKLRLDNNEISQMLLYIYSATNYSVVVA